MKPPRVSRGALNPGYNCALNPVYAAGASLATRSANMHHRPCAGIILR
jgi:hypothetical protein